VTIAIYPGSFDPVHVGHLGVIERGAGKFDELVVAVMANPAKAGFLGVAQRVLLIRQATSHLVNVRCCAHDGLAVDAARAEGADVIVRSAAKEWQAEISMAAHNKRISGIETIMIAADTATAWVSSTLIRSLARDRNYNELQRLVPAAVLAALDVGYPPASLS
jgi:pantetheine-phosphate adenylyltransferase